MDCTPIELSEGQTKKEHGNLTSCRAGKGLTPCSYSGYTGKPRVSFFTNK